MWHTTAIILKSTYKNLIESIVCWCFGNLCSMSCWHIVWKTATSCSFCGPSTEGCGQNDASFNEMKSSPGFSASFATVLVRARPPLPSEAAYGHCVRILVQVRVTEGWFFPRHSPNRQQIGKRHEKAWFVCECNFNIIYLIQLSFKPLHSCKFGKVRGIRGRSCCGKVMMVFSPRHHVTVRQGCWGETNQRPWLGPGLGCKQWSSLLLAKDWGQESCPNKRDWSTWWW